MSSREYEVEITRENAPYAPEEELGTYKATRWTWREKQEAIMRASETLDEAKGLIELNVIEFEIEQIMLCITPPDGFILDRERMNRIDADVGDALLAACRKVNGTTLSERTAFLEQSEQEESTTG